MTQWITVANVADLPVGSKKVIYVEQRSILLIHTDQGFYAIENKCSHDGVDLNEGWLAGERMVCPRHGAQFCLKTGAALTPPAYEALDIFSIKIDGDNIQIGLTSS